MWFDWFDLGGEENEAEYIQKFRELYSEEILTEEGFTVFCPNEDEDIKHVWRGGINGGRKFNKGRAVRIGWIKEIIMKTEKRKIKVSPKNKQIYFVSVISKGTYYVVRGRYIKSKNKIRIFTAHLVSHEQVRGY